jgi:ribosome modulation factor
MKRQKRNRFTRARSKGFTAGIKGKSSDACPFNSCDIKEYWLNGWRDARKALNSGYF